MSRKLALLIASPIHGLRGPLNDVETIAKVLTRQSFRVTRCCGPNATRDGILAAWRRLIDESKAGDAVVVYYSGHGGLVEIAASRETPSALDSHENWRTQFIVPVDYDESTDEDFRGILDVELSHLLQDMTERTDNVTVILDCCHAGRTARYPDYRDKAFPKRLSEVQHHDLRLHVDRLRRRGQLRGETSLLGNPKAVRVMAAAATETAWEYENTQGKWTGALTDALAQAIDEVQTSGHEVSWKTTLLRARGLVNERFPQQHPIAEGPDVRLLFLTTEITPGALALRLEDGESVLQGGRVAGVREGNVYAIMPFGHERADERLSIGTATATNVNGFKARAELHLAPASHLPDDGALAFIISEALPRWPVIFPSKLKDLQESIANSKYLRPWSEVDTPLAEVQQHIDKVVLCTRSGIQIAYQPLPSSSSSSVQGFGDIIRAAEQLARAQDLLALRCEKREEALSHGIDITLGLVDKGKPTRTIRQDGTDTVVEHDRMYISLTNGGTTTIYISVFEINVAGKVCLISTHSPTGIELPPGRSSTLGRDQFGARLKGLELTWPNSVPKLQPVQEQLVLILTDAPVDLRQLANPAHRPKETRGSLSSLQELASCISCRKTRDMQSDTGVAPISYDVAHVPFSLSPERTITREESGFAIGDWLWPSETPMLAGQIPNPESIPSCEDLPSCPPAMVDRTREYTSKGVIGAIFRATRGIPPCVWVVNQHCEEITVVVSKYRPNRMLAGAGVSASATGGGLDLNTTTFISPATKKILMPERCGPKRSTAVFPLWTRKEGFGVISIFTGPGQRLYIENDKIPIGATAYFTNQPDLRTVGYDGMVLKCERPV